MNRLLLSGVAFIAISKHKEASNAYTASQLDIAEVIAIINTIAPQAF
jgi:hypothetical protein